MKLVILAAVAPDGTIGHAGKIPWHISADLKRFKRLTMGQTVIMGRKTFESLGQPLPGRRNIVLTRRAPIPGVECCDSLEAALRSCGDATVFIIGGADVYRQALPMADTLLLTHVRLPASGDTKFPAYDRSEWVEVSREDTAECSFVEYRRNFPLATGRSLA